MGRVYLCVFVVLLASLASAQVEPSRSATVYLNQGAFSLTFGKQDPAGVAWGNFEESINATGWGRLFVTTNANNTDEQQGYAAGYLEAALTPQLIYYYHLNTKDYLLFDEEQPGIDKWLTENDAWARAQIAKNYKTSEYWQQIGVIYAQVFSFPLQICKILFISVSPFFFSRWMECSKPTTNSETQPPLKS